MRAGARSRLMGPLFAAALLAAGCNQNSTPWPWLQPSAAPSVDGGGLDAAVLPGEASAPVAGPDLGEAWTTEPDPESFIPLADGTMVAPDQYLVMLDPSSTKADAQKVAESVDGDVGGHIEYIGVWKILVWPNYHTAIILDRLRTLQKQPGVLAAAPVTLVAVQSAPDCAPSLADSAYAGANSGAYDLIGVKAAWRALYASRVPVNPVHLGLTDTSLTQDQNGKIEWEFDDLTFARPPETVPAPDSAQYGTNHGNQMLGLIAGDAGDGGVAGVDSPLGSRLLVTQNTLGGPAVKDQPTKWTQNDAPTYSDLTLQKTIDLIESGATVINGSWGAQSISPNNAGTAAIWKALFRRTAQEHPNVLFVFAAGNENGTLDGSNYYPGGIPADNVITVGNIGNDNHRVKGEGGSDAVSPGSGGEITLGAPGDQAVRGRISDGRVMHLGGGTSSATALVSGTAAMIRSIDPTLKAADIKKLIASTAVKGDADVGGRTLRTDLAVRKAIDGVRARNHWAPLTDEQIEAVTPLCQIDVRASLTQRLDQPAGASRWQVTASIDASATPGRMVELSLVEDGLRPSNWSQAVTAGGGKASWSVLVSKDGAWITVTRLDVGFWLKYRLRDDAAATPTPTSTPTDTPGPDVDCSKPGPSLGDPDYIKWWLACKPIPT